MFLITSETVGSIIPAASNVVKFELSDFAVNYRKNRQMSPLYTFIFKRKYLLSK